MVSRGQRIVCARVHSPPAVLSAKVSFSYLICTYPSVHSTHLCILPNCAFPCTRFALVVGQPHSRNLLISLLVPTRPPKNLQGPVRVSIRPPNHMFFYCSLLASTIPDTEKDTPCGYKKRQLHRNQSGENEVERARKFRRGKG